ncbi:Putative endonuclease/exonuclease/phosphatase [Septoria linicola]|uniref:Endonuclease/exonuclease/phosphatase n=1 Tax=Septoria linicola TaxID=215465 RepID=A0A9Q9EK36_9PEZI|nr:putative endonuclease/exonuclease/phosphatase [Septoria linicola]USW54406.1 Putative endonuclease/exonuclease/phosphatase [Septoria linicola]
MRFASIAATAIAIPSVLAASGTFNILSFNIAGLPAFLNDNSIPGGKRAAAKQIGQKFASGAYDVIHVQEDFAFHDEIYDNDNHPYRTKTTGNVPGGSGLNTLANLNWTDLRRVTWDVCDIGQGDCLTPKGFTYMRVDIGEGTTADFYNLHADAGNGNGDEGARRSNIQQVADHIDSVSAGQPVIVYGDTNCLYSDPTSNIRILGTQNSLRDTWVDFQHGGVIPGNAPECTDPTTNQTCEVLDKVLYRGGNTTTLTATRHEYVTDRFLQANGDRLSDHNAVLVEFAWST